MISLKTARFNPWREMAILMIMLMEVCWVTPWFRSLTPATYAVSSAIAFLILFCMVFVAHVTVRFMEYLRLKKNIRQGIIILLLFIGILVGLKTLLYSHDSLSFFELINRPLRSFSDWKSLIPDEFVIIIVVLIGWWRGISIAQEHIGPSSVSNHFVIGIVMYVVFVFINTMVTGETPGDFFYLFLFFSLLAMSSARMAVLGTLRGGKQNVFDRRWFLGVLFAASVVVSLSAFMGSVMGEQFAWVGYIFLGIFGSLILLIWIIVSPLLTLLINWIGNLTGQSHALDSLSKSLQNISDMMRGFGQRITDMLDKSGIGELVSRLGPTLKAILLGSIVLVVIAGIVLWVAFTLWKDRERRRLDEEQNSMLKGGDLWRMLQDLLRQRWGELMNTVAGVADLRHRQRLRAAARIRQIYADLLELCEKLDQPRPDSLTPLEFIPALEQLFPKFQSEVNVITKAYLGVRYGQLPETRSEVQEVENGWKSIKIQGDELYEELKRKKKSMRPVEKMNIHKPPKSKNTRDN